VFKRVEWRDAGIAGPGIAGPGIAGAAQGLHNDLTESSTTRSGTELRVLLADDDAAVSDPDRAAVIEAALHDAGASVILRPNPSEPLLEAVARVAPEVVIVGMQRPDRDTLDDVRHMTRHDPRPIVMFVDVDDPAFMEAAIEAGVSSYNVVGTRLPDIKPIIQAAIAMFRRFRQIEVELRRAEQGLAERAVIDRAKVVLIRTRRMSEPDAYKWLRRQAMDRGRRIADIAAELLETTDGA
jgi:response regulator NasT